MAFFLPVLTKTYDPYDIDQNMFAMYYPSVRCIPIVCSGQVAKDGYGTATVDGVEIDHGVCVKLSMSPLPILFLPVGQAATQFGKTYTVKLKGYKTEGGGKFINATFKIKTPAPRCADGKHTENEACAKAVSDEGIVLLENDGTLPLVKGAKVALKGEYFNFRIAVIGASHIKPRYRYTIQEAINGVFTADDGADTALFFISRSSSENRDNKPIAGGYYLTDEEKNGIKECVDKYKKVVLVLNTAYPIEMNFIKKSGVNAIIWTGACGQRGSESLIDIISGEVTPSARLADSWPLDYYDMPAAHNFINLDENAPLFTDDGTKHGARVYYEERQYVGYRYFTSYNKPAAYLFGHGLSYTKFKLSAECEITDGGLNVKCSVKNIGSRNGKNAVLVYVKNPDGGLDKPKYVFAGFDKTRCLAPDEEEELQITVPFADIAVYDDNKKCFVLEKGGYEVLVGGAIDECLVAGSFEFAQDKVVKNTVSVCAPLEKVGDIDENGKVSVRTAIVDSKEHIAVKAKFVKPSYKPIEKHKGKKIMLQDVKADPSLLDKFVSQLSASELADIVVCNGHCWYPGGIGAAGKLAKNSKYGITRVYMSDGNCGVNLYRRTTGFPTSNVLACTFNKQLAYEVGKVLALESKEEGIAINLGPGGNLHRNILCGRHPEYFSEDPILSGTFMGWQAKGEEENGVLATYKHLFGNQIEFERKSAHSVIDERTVRELYLKVFEKAFSVYKASCVMTSYNPVNGIYPCENSELLNDLLRREWGFDGFVMTDWDSYSTSDEIKSINAGTDLLTPGTRRHYRKVLKAYKSGEISLGTLQNAAKNIIKVLIKYETLSDNKVR